MKKINTKFIPPKVILKEKKEIGEEIYQKSKTRLEYVFDEEDVLKMSKMKFKKDIIAYKQDLLLKNKFKIQEVPIDDNA